MHPTNNSKLLPIAEINNPNLAKKNTSPGKF